MIQNQNSGWNIAFTEMVDLANEKVGGTAISTNDDFFAPKENLVKASTPIFIADKYTEFGKWMDGWESRRKRNLVHESHDWCIVKLGIPGAIHGVDVDTAFFTGNYPEYCSIEATHASENASPESLSAAKWTEILSKSKLQGGSHNLFTILVRERFTHVRLKIFPDGGVARLRVYGEVLPDPKKLSSNTPIDLAALENGGVVITCNDSFFSPKENLILPGRAQHMGEGWETRRKRGPGYDWIIVNLGTSGTLSKIEVDTHHYKGNFPESCSIDAAFIPGARLLPVDFREGKTIEWSEVLPRTKLQADTKHTFEKELKPENLKKKFNYIRLNIYPDGGVSRLRVYGVPSA